jgi:hypothetical protein
MDAGDIVSRNAAAAERHSVLASFNIAGDGVNVFIAQTFFQRESLFGGSVMQMIYNLLGRLCFSRQQDWEQRRSAKTLVLTVAFALALGFAVAEVIRIMYYHKKG